jgi:hypothetical protein
MGVAMYIELQKRVPTVEECVGGKELCWPELDAAAKRLRVRPLEEFVSMTAEEEDDLMKEDEARIPTPPVKWFSAAEGLKTVDALLREAGRSRDLRPAKDALLECRRVLRAAKKHRVKWRMVLDF